MMMNGFAKLLADLSDADVDFIVVGGLAVAFCGYVRATDDVDILVQADAANVKRLLDALSNFGQGAARELDIDDFTLEEGAIRIVESFPLDVFTQMSGLQYEDLYPMTKRRMIGSREIIYLGRDGLIRLKEDSLRPKDQLDVQALKRMDDASD